MVGGGNISISSVGAITGVNSVTAAASTDLTLNAGSGNQNINLVPAGSGGIKFGATTAGSGLLRLSNAAIIASRNAANNGDFTLIGSNGSDQVVIGTGASFVSIQNGAAVSGKIISGKVLHADQSGANTGALLQVAGGEAIAKSLLVGTSVSASTTSFLRFLLETAPFTVTSTTNVANLNASSLNGATFASPGTIGGTTPGIGNFSAAAALRSEAASRLLVLQNSAAIATGNTVHLTLAASPTSTAWYVGTVQDSTSVGNSRLTIGQVGGSFNAFILPANADGTAATFITHP